MDVGEWLRQLGLGQYAAAFAANDVDAEVLAKLTAEDLLGLGVASIGHRRKLLSEIARLSVSDAGAERRQLTVMFCDLVGSTEMSGRLDPEDMRAIISAHHGSCAEQIAANGGYVAKYMGDGVVAYFGYPSAREQDAENAVRAGLAIAAAAPRQTAAESPLRVRVGIATGVVVVGDLVGSGGSQERGVVGDTPNLAARLQGVAPPDGVVIAESTRRLIGDLFELEDLGPQSLKGVAEPLRAYLALRERSVESRYEALRAGELAPIVGRQDEIDLLLDRWARAREGAGQVVLLCGEAGVGKSRLTAALMERLAAETYARQRFFGSPQHTDSALYPIVAQFRRALAAKAGDDVGARLDKLQAMLAGDAAENGAAALIAALLSLDDDGRLPPLTLSPHIQRRMTLEALMAQLEGVSRQSPLLLIFEDAHWADPSSVEWLGAVVARIAGWRAMLVVTARPEFAPPWRPRPEVSVVTLDRLSIAEVDALVDGIVGDRRLPAGLRKDILERADGVPLFVEEMTKAILEAETERAGNATLAASPPRAYAVPATLHASLMARLDRSGEAKGVAQIGAALGREFSLELLAAVADRGEAELRSALDRLIGAGLLVRKGPPLRPTFLFKHALVQDAAYSTLLREPRRALHARIVRAFEKQFPEVAAGQPELLARHCAQAGLVEKAVAYGGVAAERALSLSALAEAAESLKRALALIEASPSTSALRRQRIKLQVALITPLVRVAGQSSEAVRQAVERASALISEAEAMGEAPDDPLLLFGVLFATMIAKITAFEGPATVELADSFLTLAQAQNNSGLNIAFMNFKAQAKFNNGEFEEARQLADRSLAMFDPDQHRWLATRFGDDQRVVNLGFRGVILYVLGFSDQAREDARFIVAEARELGQAATLAFALHYAAWIALFLGDHARVVEMQDELAALAQSKGMPLWIADGNYTRGVLLARIGDPAEGVRCLSEALVGLRAMGATSYEPLVLTATAVAQLRLRQFDLALANVRAAQACGMAWYRPETLRVEAEVLAHLDVASAQSKFVVAIEAARALKAKAWELRSATSFARLHQAQGRRDEARALLEATLAGFSEGFGARDFSEARAVLRELAR